MTSEPSLIFIPNLENMTMLTNKNMFVYPSKMGGLVKWKQEISFKVPDGVFSN